jgi:hypothetical protein
MASPFRKGRQERVFTQPIDRREYNNKTNIYNRMRRFMVDEYRKIYEKILKGIELTEKRRGEVINIAVEIENSLSDIISACFFPPVAPKGIMGVDTLNKMGIALKTLILSKIDFRDKIEILKDVLIVMKPNVMMRNKSFINKIIKDIDKVRVFRNILAHSGINVELNNTIEKSDSKQHEILHVTEYKKGKIRKYTINEKEYNAQMIIVLEAHFYLFLLFELLSDNPTIADDAQNFIDDKYPEKFSK